MNHCLDRIRVKDRLDEFSRRAVAMVAYFGNDIPDYFDVSSGTWRLNGGWTEGFWAGLLWWLYSYSGDNRLALAARQTTRRVAEAHADWDDHDLGFVYESTCVLAQRCGAADDTMVPSALAAAHRLAERYRPDGRYIPAHGPVGGSRAGFAIIDTVMNLELLYWAAHTDGAPGVAKIATATAHSIAQRHVRPDGSSCQVLWLEPTTGEIIRPEAVMAVSVDSCWARGQAWGIHGFATVYRQTGDVAFLQVAERMAGYFITKLPTDGVVFHDLDDPTIPEVPRDSSAQAIAAGGLLTLAECADDPEGRRHWLRLAETLLLPLWEHCVNDEAPGDMPRGFLGRGCKSLRKQQGVVSDLVFGDFYFVASLVRWLRLADNE